MPSAAEMSMSACAVMRMVWILIPYVLAVTTALCLWKGKEAFTARMSLVIFSWTLVIGMLLSTLWLSVSMTMDPGGARISYAGALLTEPLLRRIALIMGGLAIHTLLYMVWAIGQLDGTRRNVIANWLAVSAVALALCSLIPQVRFWRRVYNRDTMERSLVWHRSVAQLTDAFTADWTQTEPQGWEALLLRANFLYSAGRTAEAQAIDRRLVALPPGALPGALEQFIRQRLDSGL